jgi:tmRNA-binding protein
VSSFKLISLTTNGSTGAFRWTKKEKLLLPHKEVTKIKKIDFLGYIFVGFSASYIKCRIWVNMGKKSGNQSCPIGAQD